MFTSVVVLAAALLTPSPATVQDHGEAAWASSDTVWAVERGQTIVIENISGSVRVETWDRLEVEIAPRRSDRIRFRAEADRRSFRIRPEDRKGRDLSLPYVVRVPRSSAVEIRGHELDVRVEDHAGGLAINTLEGDIDLFGVSGDVAARSVDGQVTVRESSGNFELFSLDDDIRVEQFQGQLRVEANDGEILLWDVDVEVLEAATVDGDIEFSGALAPGGRYLIVTHDGDIDMAIEGEPNARMLVSTYEGEFESEFPILLTRLESGQEFDFKLGDGSAEVRLEAFDGEVTVRRASGRRDRRGGDRNDNR